MKQYKFLCTNMCGRDFLDDDLRFIGDKSNLNIDEWYNNAMAHAINHDDIQDYIEEQKEYNEEFNYSIKDFQCKFIESNEDKEFINKIFHESCKNLSGNSEINEIIKSLDMAASESLTKLECSKFIKDYGFVDKNCKYLYEIYGGDHYIIIQEIES